MSDLPDRILLPTVDAALNLVATVLLLSGRRAVRRGDVDGHRRRMFAALAVSAAFLACYLTYHALYPPFPFGGQGVIRGLYLAVLLSHILLAALLPFLVVPTVVLALRDRREAHRRLARWTYPIWLYVSVTGVLVYVMLYLLWPGQEVP